MDASPGVLWPTESPDSLTTGVSDWSPSSSGSEFALEDEEEPPSLQQEEASGPTEVILHVYNLRHFKRVRFANAILQPLGSGVYHTAVEVYGTELSFGFREGATGVFERRPGTDNKHRYREAVSMGTTSLSRAEVQQLVRRLKREWQGDDYHMLRHNCQHFASELCAQLGVGGLPPWVTSLVPVIACLADMRKQGKKQGKETSKAAKAFVRDLLATGQVMPRQPNALGGC